MEIAPTTKISALIKENPAAIDAIASINRHFEKLRNPMLRKILASRVTISDAARIGGCQVEDFFKKLVPLGFEVKMEPVQEVTIENPSKGAYPQFLKRLSADGFLYLDVREDIATGNDPFQRIMAAVEKVNGQNALVLQNTFEPTPLLQILQKRGFKSYSEAKGSDLVYTYFWRESEEAVVVTANKKEEETNFAQLLAQFAGNLKEIDVRQLEMPLPMVTILHELEWLPTGHALYVRHKRVPQFLLPQLESRGFHVSIQEVGLEEVYLLIFKPSRHE
ncbi:hypothetical protein TH61_17290 [Rufibacter sp. DG15C]|uniref:DUF2249 domain-containing protein n=1 Tax=Rufibacter sp. DG15C TaxID=1379909 RepID=UPI00078EB3DA|nr:DUF2249 domain-containing protein [Rufibacter sp. DG15C]AMM52584.1 hypothetical protein TH61_17290 [Rufibacter sp. DG15C]